MSDKRYAAAGSGSGSGTHTRTEKEEERGMKISKPLVFSSSPSDDRSAALCVSESAGSVSEKPR